MRMFLTIMFWVVIIGLDLFLPYPALARHHKKKPTPTATPTTGVRLQNPVQAPDPKSIE